MWLRDFQHGGRCVGLALALVGLTACNYDGPPAPSPTLGNVDGTWRGIIRFTTGGQPAEQTFQMTLSQPSGSESVVGTYTAERFKGGITGSTTTSRFSGAFEFDTFTQSGTPCRGAFTVSGSIGGSTLTWTSPRVDGATCADTPEDMTISVVR